MQDKPVTGGHKHTMKRKSNTCNQVEPIKAITTNQKKQRATPKLESFLCPECKFEFSSRENLSLHIKNLHSMTALSAKPEENDESDVGVTWIHLHGQM